MRSPVQALVCSLRVAVVSLLVCAGGYTAVVLAFARLAAPLTADGSLVTKADGTVVGSRLIAQAFTQPRWFWPRPSAVAYNAAAAGGSNKSPTNPELTDRARQTVTAFGASAERPLPAELAAASGSGLDPHISERAALWQVDRVATARALAPATVASLVRAHAFAAGGFLCGNRIVNVLELNLALEHLE